MSVTLHAGQARAWDSKKRFTYIIAGTQSGKTSFLPLMLDREIMRHGRGDYLAVTATYDLFKLKFFPEMRHYFMDIFRWQYSKSERVLFRQEKPRLFSRIVMRSADAEGGLESATAKAAILDEFGQDRFALEAHEAILRRLSLSMGRIIGCTTPYNLGWTKTEIFDKWRAGDPDIQVIQFKSTMNPSFPQEEYDRAKRTMPAWRHAMFYDGEFSRPAGMIYDDFGEDLKTPDFVIPADWPRYLGVDFGGVHQSKIWVCMDPATGIYYVYREALDGGKTTREHVKEVKQYNERTLRAWGGAKSEGQFRRDWSDAGLLVNEPDVDGVEAGISRVIQFFKEKKLYVFESCKGIIDELGRYARELDSNGQPTEKIKDKATFHRLDALRYVCGSMVAGVARAYRG
jgi:hypothetical protein